MQFITNQRIGDTTKQCIVCYANVALSEKELLKMMELEYIKSGLEEQVSPSLFQPDQLAQVTIEGGKKAEVAALKKLQEESCVVVGIHEIYGQPAILRGELR
ncbi:hypothetical protein CMK14_18880 [Candidatus Poribacteria bacterium]|nr:hypothetical protein [Candidatus Poribacteria bacterium]